MSANKDYSAYRALDPLFEMCREVFGKAVDGNHFFEWFAKDAIWENPFPVPGTKPVFHGPGELMDAFKGYGNVLRLDTVSDLQVHRSKATDGSDVIVMEYKGHGHAIVTDKPYNNAYVSIVHIKDRKIVLWRDYVDQMIAIEAVGGLGPILAMLGEK
jgi:ketosteroid isomerase-like protein